MSIGVWFLIAIFGAAAVRELLDSHLPRKAAKAQQ